MIPKVIHYCWFGEGKHSQLEQRCMDSWRTLLPEFEIKRWDAASLNVDNKYVETCVRRKLWARLANFVRLEALYREGGIYLDTDVEVIKDMTPLLSDTCFLGFQQEEQHADWVNNAVMGSVAGHGFLRKFMDRLEATFERTGRFGRGPGIATECLAEMGLRSYGLQRIGDVTLYPVPYFYPFSWLEDYSPSKITADTYAVHYWAGSWKSGFSLEMPRPLRRLRRAAASWVRRLAQRR